MTYKEMPIKQQQQSRAIRFGLIIAAGVILLITPVFMPSYLQGIMTKILIFAIFGASLDLLLGYTGLFSLGHAAYFGLAGYATAYLTVSMGIQNFWLSFSISVLAATLLAAVFGLIALRMSGLYFIIVTFALAQMLYGLATKWHWITGGASGLAGIRYPNLGLPDFTWNALTFYYFVFLFFLCSFFIMKRLIESPFGLALKGIYESESRMSVLGYNTWLHKYIVFVIGGLFAGVSGALFAHYNGLMHPSFFSLTLSGNVMLMVLIGGAGILFGSIIGAAVFILLEFYASIFFPERWPLIMGVVFILVVMFLRGGIAAHIPKLMNLPVLAQKCGTLPEKAE